VIKTVKWICFDGKCIYARVSFVKQFSPKSATAFSMQPKMEMVVYCMKHHKNVKKALTNCRDFQNMTLTRYP